MTRKTLGICILFILSITLGGSPKSASTRKVFEPNPTPAPPLHSTGGMPNLQGEKAAEHLKRDGGYDSLNQAVQATLFSQQTKLTAFDGTTFDRFGNSVGVSDETVVIGAPGDDNAAGSAYVFARTGTTWSFQQKLTPADSAVNYRFGTSVAVDGDTLAVGALFASGPVNINQGAVYIFVRTGTVWTEQQKLTIPSGMAVDRFGWSVALQGETVVAGAPGVEGNGANVDQGAAYVFVRTGETWTQQQKLTASDGMDRDEFGTAVAIDGETILVGVKRTPGLGSATQGAVYVFVRAGITWTEQQKLTGTEGGPFDGFGESVAIDGETALIGAKGDTSFWGAVYFFTRTGSVWTEQQKLTNDQRYYLPLFGTSVVLNGDTALVGAIGADVHKGETIVFTRTGTSWTEQQRLTASDGAPSNAFGVSIALEGGTALIGAPGDNGLQGGVYVFSLDGPTSSLAVTGANPICRGSSTTVTVTVSGGTPPYSVTLSNGGGTQTGPGPIFNFTVSPTTTTTYTLQSGSDANNLPITGGNATVTVSQPPSTANAGSDQSVCLGQGVSLGADAPASGIGQWTVQSGPNTGPTQFSNAGSPTSTFTPAGGAGTYTLRWTISNPPCAPTTDDVVITILPGPSLAEAGPNQTICTTSVAALTANTPTSGTGLWMVQSGPSTSQTQFSNAGSPTSTFTPASGAGTYTLRWTISTPLCPPSSDTVVIRVNAPPTAANAGADQTVCPSSGAVLAANAPASGTGRWTVQGGPNTGTGQFSNVNSPTSTFTPAGGAGSYVLRWTITSGGCPASFDDVVVTVNAGPSRADAGPDRLVCLTVGSTTLAANLPAVGSGQWTVQSGPNTNASQFSSANSPTSAFTPAGGVGTYVLRWTISLPGACPPSFDEATVTVTASCAELSVVYAADTQNHRIQRFDGNAWSVVVGNGISGTAANRCNLPKAVTASADGSRIYVSDTGNNRITFSTDGGTTWAVFAATGPGFNQVRSPQGLALDAAGNLYVADALNERVLRFAGGLPGTAAVLASSGFGAGQVKSPRGLAIDNAGNLYVTDKVLHRLLRIANAASVAVANTGTAVVSGQGLGLSNLNGPEGVAVDNAGNVFVADTLNERVIRFTNGTAPGVVMTDGAGSILGRVSRPEGVTVTTFTAGPLAGQPFLIVGDTGANRIQGRPFATSTWQLVGTPNTVGSGVGQFRLPSQIR